jgi:hypothetical protein
MVRGVPDLAGQIDKPPVSLGGVRRGDHEPNFLDPPSRALHSLDPVTGPRRPERHPAVTSGAPSTLASDTELSTGPGSTSAERPRS